MWDDDGLSPSKDWSLAADGVDQSTAESSGAGTVGLGGGVPVAGPLTRLSALETGTKPWSCGDWLQVVVSGAEELPKEDATQSPSGERGCAVETSPAHQLSQSLFTATRAGCWLLAGTVALEQLPRYARLKIHPGKMPSPFWASVDHALPSRAESFLVFRIITVPSPSGLVAFRQPPCCWSA